MSLLKKQLFSKLAIASAVAGSLILQGCAPVIVGSAATGAVVANDSRTTGTFVEDEAIELKIRNSLISDSSLKGLVHINATSINTNVLLTGEASTEGARKRVFEIAKNTEKVNHVFNEIALAAPSALLARSSDTALTANVKTRLLADQSISGTKIKIVTEAGIVYLMGLISRTDGNAAAQIASRVSGVQKVVKLFEYID